ncbi:response regulator transcription factor [Corynebacterium sp. TAE3-ERU12]|uniref:response regulator n=1 Tax=Corynebacterium sp. TAE3-ERU12 TaxID=2849491 RepID=UPI001C438CC7|nr:response regulator transcription factor [Corynebacterium sp. TAE3-ERU12]MBV7294891.1 response regulator transcription factor [Corynebacterium sp. TAE3-ERU12]
MIRVLIADDHPVVRAGLRSVLESAGDIDVVGESDNPDAAVRACVSGDIDVVLMDLRFGDSPGSAATAGGVGATEQIRQQPNPPQVLVVTNYSSDADVLGAVSAGAVGYLLKDAAPAELIDGVRCAARGETVLSRQVAGQLMGRMRSPATQLTSRETEVLNLVAEGLSNRVIARQLVLTEATVKSHLVHIFTKLDVGSRTAAVAEAKKRGIL